MSKESYIQTPERNHRKINPNKVKLFGQKALLLLAVSVGVGAFLENSFEPPKFSVETKTHIVEPGDGLRDASKYVDGVGSVDIRQVDYYIENMPQNEEVLSDGLQPGEVLIIPDSVEKP